MTEKGPMGKIIHFEERKRALKKRRGGVNIQRQQGAVTRQVDFSPEALEAVNFIVEQNKIDFDTAINRSIGLLRYLTEVEESGGRVLKQGRIFTRQVFITPKKK